MMKDPLFSSWKVFRGNKKYPPRFGGKGAWRNISPKKAPAFLVMDSHGFVGLYHCRIPCQILGTVFSVAEKNRGGKNPLNKPSSLAQNANSFCFCPPPQVQHEVEFPVEEALGFVTVFRLLPRYLCKRQHSAKNNQPPRCVTIKLGITSST